MYYIMCVHAYYVHAYYVHAYYVHACYALACHARTCYNTNINMTIRSLCISHDRICIKSYLCTFVSRYIHIGIMRIPVSYNAHIHAIYVLYLTHIYLAS